MESGQENKVIDAFLEERLDAMCDGMVEAIRREVEHLRAEGLPIYVSDNGRVIDLQKVNQAGNSLGDGPS